MDAVKTGFADRLWGIRCFQIPASCIDNVDTPAEKELDVATISPPRKEQYESSG
jgi:hypothetical protein